SDMKYTVRRGSKILYRGDDEDKAVRVWHAALAMNSPMIEYHLRPNPFRDGLAGDAIRHEKGEFLQPRKPGLGITPDEKVIERYRLKG
ncbi:MAG: hypothetical protein JRM83_07445, partial [Nitrososphaerota archaeon]|nr:hypothetical protein [Nitrososphaerota archaeon]